MNRLFVIIDTNGKKSYKSVMYRQETRYLFIKQYKRINLLKNITIYVNRSTAYIISVVTIFLNVQSIFKVTINMGTESVNNIGCLDF